MDLYQELILEHAKRPHRPGLRAPFDAEVHHVNPTCGDEVTVRVHVTGDAGSPVLDDVSFDALGCSISVASASMMAEQITGHRLDEVGGTHAAIKKLLTGRGTVAGDEGVIGDAIALAGVAKYPARVKCALLGWMALEDALAQAGHALGPNPGRNGGPRTTAQEGTA